MKWSIDRKLLFFGVGLLAIILGAGCAAHRPQVCDEGVKIETSDGVRVAETTEKPGEKVFVDDKGAVEVVSTPFGYVKHRIKQPEEESSTPAPAELPVSSAPEVRVPTAQPPPVSRAEPTGPGPRAAQEPGKKAPIKGKGQIVFNFDDADLYEVIRTIAELLNINYIVDPNVRGKVTIHTAGGLRKEDLFPVFFQILEVNGLTAIKEGSLYKIVQLKDAPRMQISARFGSEGEDVPPGERVIIQIIPLKFISAQEMTKVLTPFISAGGAIISGGVSNTMLVVDKGMNILKVLRLVEAFDVNVFEMFNHRFYYLEYLDAEEIVEAFTNIVGSYGDIAKDIVNVIAIKRLNALLVISSNPQAFEKVELFIRQLDVPSEEVDPRIYVYSVKNGEANDLADLLNSVFAWEPSAKEKTTKDKSEKKAETAPSRNPFSRKTREAKAKEAPKAAKEPKETVVSGKMGSVGSGTLRGEINITADEIRNALIIEAIPADYRVIKNILRQIDVLPRQVLIEVTIAEISLDESTELGIAWTYLKGPGSLSTSLLDASLGSSGFKYTIGMTKRWTSALAFLAGQDKVNILSSPSILASDNKEAKIDISTEIPVASTAIKYTSDKEPVLETTIEYRDTGVLLSVTPHINERGLVTMDINQEVSEQSKYVDIGEGRYPSFYKRSVKTTLTVKHAQTIVIGGLIKETKSEESLGAPWLSKMPIIRYLFGKEIKLVSKKELIILITPYVIVSLEDVDAVTEEFKSKVGNVMKMYRK